eukprot:scaffold1169_cov367-Prasinococcus_capsulatus_cf.AAC.20
MSAWSKGQRRSRFLLEDGDPTRQWQADAERVGGSSARPAAGEAGPASSPVASTEGVGPTTTTTPPQGLPERGLDEHQVRGSTTTALGALQLANETLWEDITQDPEVDQLTLDGSPFAPFLVTLRNSSEIDQYRRVLKAKYNKMLPLCIEERKAAKNSHAGLNPELDKLRECLSHFDNGECPYPSQQLREIARTLPGFRMLERAIDGCTTVTSKGECSSIKGNPETNIEGSPPSGSIFPEKPLPSQRWGSCALVGNGPHIKLTDNGPHIDAHDTVWRFNLVPTDGLSTYTGKKTHVRVFNRMRAQEAAGLRPSSDRKFLHTSAGEEWIFWHYGVVGFLNNVAKNYPQVSLRLLSPDALNWLIDVYFELRRNMIELGMGTFACPDTLSSGIHSVMLANKFCEQVSWRCPTAQAESAGGCSGQPKAQPA